MRRHAIMNSVRRSTFFNLEKIDYRIETACALV